MMKSYHSIPDRDEETETVVPTENDSNVQDATVPQESGLVGARFLKMAVVVACTVVFSALAVQSNTSFKSTNSKVPISQMTSLDQLPSDTVFSDVSDTDQTHIFSLYQRKFSKVYTSDEEYDSRLSTFKSRLATIDSKNVAEKVRGGSARHGITKYSDLSLDELKASLSNARPNQSQKQDVGVALTAKVEKYKGSDTAKDWSGVLTTPIIDQGFCGSCWAFSTAFQMESDAIRAGLLTTSDSLSAQELISCDSNDLGCDGGWTELGFSYAMENGLHLTTDYPYTSYWGKAASCKTMSSSKTKVKVQNFYELSTEDEMIDYVMTTGPLSICAASSDWYTYVDGVLSTCGGEVDHCVQVVGVDKEQGYWKVRNTWGTDWGEDGYLRISLGSNTCGILDDPMYTEVTLE
jgi:C1A family cysteine protease